MISLVTICHHADICIIIEYIPHIVHFMPVTHLFCYCKLAPLNSLLISLPPHTLTLPSYLKLIHLEIPGQQKLDCITTFEMDEGADSLSICRKISGRIMTHSGCSWWTVHPSRHPSLAELSHAAVLNHSWPRGQAVAHLGPGAFPNADFPTCWFSASVPLPENWGPENSLPWICLLHCRKLSSISGLSTHSMPATPPTPPTPAQLWLPKCLFGTGSPQLRTTAPAGSSSSFRFQLECHCL